MVFIEYIVTGGSGQRDHIVDHGSTFTHSLQKLVTQETRKQDIAEKCKHIPDHGYSLTIGVSFKRGAGTADTRLKDTAEECQYYGSRLLSHLGLSFKMGRYPGDTRLNKTAEECQYYGSRLLSHPGVSSRQGMIL
jgi:hypothetical protein